MSAHQAGGQPAAAAQPVQHPVQHFDPDDDQHRDQPGGEHGGPLLAVLRRAAQTAVDAGYPVFPIAPGTKVPAVADWEHAATRDPATVRRWWRHTPYNIGLATGPAGLVVVDLDDGHGAPPPQPFAGARGGLDVLNRLATAVGAAVPTDTFSVATPTGGCHLYFPGPGRARAAQHPGPARVAHRHPRARSCRGSRRVQKGACLG